MKTGRIAAAVALAGVVIGLTAAPAAACGGLVAPNGAVRLLRTSTLAAYHDGVEHYVTSFKFAGGGVDATGPKEFGSIVPLPGVPTSVERGGDWTLQRLSREVTFQGQSATTTAEASNTTAKRTSATVLLETRIDALDLTVLQGGGQAVGDWAREHGFTLTPDAPEVLDFYARRSPIFLAARFNAAAARSKGLQLGDGTPIHLTIPVDNPWVPLRILTLGRGALEPVNADVFLLTDKQPSLLPAPHTGMTLDRSESASSSLLTDLRSDKSMSWVPNDMWLSYLRIDTTSEKLHTDLAIDANGIKPAVLETGDNASAAPASDGDSSTLPLWLLAGGLAIGTAVAVALVAVRASPTRSP